MSPFRAWRDGIRRVVSAPFLVVVVWTMTTLVSIPFVFVMRGEIADSLGHSLEADAAARGMNYEWMQEFAGQSTGLRTTLRPTVVGFAAVLDNLSAYLDNVRRPAAVAAASGVYVLTWIFLSGGILSRYAGNEVRGRGFVSACAAFFLRLFRLAILMAVVFGLLFGVLHPWLFTTLYPRLVQGADVERTAFVIRVGLYGVFVFLLAAANLLFDYARVRVVVEDRRSVTVGLLASWRFIGKNPAGAIGVYLLDALLFAATLAVYSYIAPQGGGIGVMVWAAFVIGQAYVAARLCVRLLFWASETAMVQAALNGPPSLTDD